MTEPRQPVWPPHPGGIRASLVSANLLPVFFCVATLTANHAIFRLGALPWTWTAATLAALVLVALLAPHLVLRGGYPGRPAAESWMIGIVALAPVLMSLLLGINRDFPFSGDHSFHIKQTLYLAFWWLSPPATPPLPIVGHELSADAVRALAARPYLLLVSRAALLAAIFVGVALCYRRTRLLAAALAAVALIAWGLCEQTIYLRYPAAGYLLAIPFSGPAFLAGDLDLGGRIANVMAAPLWLYVLRPFIVGRWPDWKILPVAALLLWHKDVIYYFDSVYLEPWAVVFCLLAIEVLIARGAQGASVACLMIGAAATFKEPAIFALPFVWLAGTPWRLDLRGLATLCGAALAAGFPFVLFFIGRASIPDAVLGSGRNVHFGMSYAELVHYADGAGLQMAYVLDNTTALPVLAALAALAVLLVRGRARLTLACMLAAGIVIALLFVLDRDSRYWTGYFRFLLNAWPFFAAGMIALGYALRTKTAAIVGFAVLLLMAPSAYTAVARSAGPASARNFAEHYDAPLVFPLKSIVAQAERDYGLPRNATIWASRPDDAVKPLPRLTIDYGPTGELICECTAERPRVLSLFVRYANLNARFADAPPTNGFAPHRANDSIWRKSRAERPLCIQKIKATCRQVIERNEGGETVAVLGFR